MEDKKYEAGRVEITSEEYRDLVTEAVMARRDASDERSEKWRVESEKKKVEDELHLTRKKIEELESVIRNLQTAYHQFGYNTTKPTPDYISANITKEDF